jgi:DNA polymerase III delta subunit
LQEKRPDCTLIKIEDDTFNKDILEEHISGRGLFSEKYIIHLDRIIKNKEKEEIVAEYISEMSKSENIFIMSEGVIGTAILGKMEKCANKIVEVVEKNKIDKKKMNEVFSLADNFASKNKLKAWEIYRRLIYDGVETESIVGTLFWQIKSVIVADKSKTASEAGLNPFVFSKSKKFSSYWKSEELQNTMKEVVEMYHEAHRGRCNLEKRVELLILNN